MEFNIERSRKEGQHLHGNPSFPGFEAADGFRLDADLLG
jgi:hypothetical protein